MKSVAVLALAGAATAQVSLYTSIAGSINKQISSLDAAIKAYTGGDGAAVIAQASSLLGGIASGSSAAAKGQDITELAAALELLSPYQAVASEVKTVVNDIVSQHDLVSKNNLGGVAYSIISQASGGAVGLAAVITGKLTGDAEAGRPIAAGSIISPILSAVNSGKSAFADISGQQSGGGSGSTTKSSGSSTTKSSGSSTTESTTETSSAPSTSSQPPQFTGGNGNGAAGLKVGGGLAAAVGALAYIL